MGLHCFPSNYPGLSSFSLQPCHCKRPTPDGVVLFSIRLSGVKPLRNLTPAYQKTNPKGLLFYFIEFSSDVLCSALVNNFIRFIFFDFIPPFLALTASLIFLCFFLLFFNYQLLMPLFYSPHLPPTNNPDGVSLLAGQG